LRDRDFPKGCAIECEILSFQDELDLRCGDRIILDQQDVQGEPLASPVVLRSLILTQIRLKIGVIKEQFLGKFWGSGSAWVRFDINILHFTRPFVPQKKSRREPNTGSRRTVAVA